MKQIIAMGGGGFSMEPDNLLLDHYILEQPFSSGPRICFIPTARGMQKGTSMIFIRRFALCPAVPPTFLCSARAMSINRLSS